MTPASMVGGLALMALPVAGFAWMGYAKRWVSEDAFIVLRVVEHVSMGHGPVYNAGERVEAYTSPLWLGLLVAWTASGGAAAWGSVLLGLVLSVMGLLLAQLASRRLTRRIPASDGLGTARLVFPLGTMVFAAIPVSWDFATSGLESGLAFAWLAGAFWLLVSSLTAGAGGHWAAALAIGLGPLVRPELGLFSLAFAIALAVIVRGRARSPSILGWMGLTAVAGAIPAAYQLFRMGYFAALVPNPALAKEAGAASWAQGWRYTEDFGVTYALWVPLGIASAWIAHLLRRAGRAGDGVAVALVLCPVAAALASALYVTRVGGDFMHGRLLLPSLFGFLLPVAVVELPPRRGWRLWPVAGISALVVWAIACAFWLRPPYAGLGVTGPAGITDERGFYTFHAGMANPVSADDYARHPYFAALRREMRDHHGTVVLLGPAGLQASGPLARSAPRRARFVLAADAIGILGYLAGPEVDVVDRQGLADPLASRLLLTARGRPGHEKQLPDAWIIARFRETNVSETLVNGEVDAARALTCGDLARLRRAIEAPMTPRRFLANVRDAWALHRLRIPPDPAEALARFCGRS